MNSPISGCFSVNGTAMEVADYAAFHRRRIRWTLAELRKCGVRRVTEIGGYPWLMTVALLEDPAFELCSTISAAEASPWPDDIGVSVGQNRFVTASGIAAAVPNYSANVERRLFDLAEEPEAVLACEVVEHLIRSPHILFLNVNRWLSTGGKLLVTTPNGAQFENPLRRTRRSPAYRSHAYDRHVFLYALDDLTDLVQLCGFRVLSAKYWNAYPRSGWSTVYDLLARVPVAYCREKFHRTIVLVAEKARDVDVLDRLPRIYDSRGAWENIAVRPARG